MSNSEFFKAAHKIARETRNAFDTYRMAFSAALKGLYAMEKKSNEKTTEEKLEELGISAWECGEMKRYYVNAEHLESIFGLAVDFYKTGNIRSAALNGEGLSNRKAADLMGQKIYFDAISGEWMQKTWAGVKALNDTLKNSIRI